MSQRQGSSYYWLVRKVEEEKAGELCYHLITMSEPNKSIIEGEEAEPLEDITFYVSTYGGSLMTCSQLWCNEFAKRVAMYQPLDLARLCRLVFFFCCRNERKAQDWTNCRVMIHAVSAGNVGTVRLVNELRIQNLQEAYIDAIVENSNFTKRSLKNSWTESKCIFIRRRSDWTWNCWYFDLIIVKRNQNG